MGARHTSTFWHLFPSLCLHFRTSYIEKNVKKKTPIHKKWPPDNSQVYWQCLTKCQRPDEYLCTEPRWTLRIPVSKASLAYRWCKCEHLLVSFHSFLITFIRHIFILSCQLISPNNKIPLFIFFFLKGC